MIGARRRLEALATEAKRLARAAGDLEECLAAGARDIQRRREAKRLEALMSRLQKEVSTASSSERAISRVQSELQIASATGQIVLGIVGATTKSAGNPVMKLFAAALDGLGKPSPVGEIRIVNLPDGDAHVLNLSQLAREGRPVGRILADVSARGCRVTTWEQFASEIETRLRELGSGNVEEGP